VQKSVFAHDPGRMNSAEAGLDEELSLSSVLYQAVRANIESGRLPPGTLLNEHRLAQQLAVSRAPVSRMLQRLAADGVLVRLEQRGYRVPGAGLSAGGETPILELPPDALEIVRGRAGWEKIWDQVESDLVACMPFGRFKINELAMADYYGVSRTVTRDLLGRLEARNLVEKVGRSQRFLRELVPGLMSDLYEVRRLLEPTALVNAAPRLSKPRLEEMRADLLLSEEKYPNLSAADIARYEDDLHVECTEACLNRPLIAALRQSQLPVLATNRLFQIYLGMPTLEPFLAEHRLVIELVLDNAPESAAVALDAHLRSAARKQQTRLKDLKAHHRPAVPLYLRQVGIG
jgi:DNA-binding GntR family transcriptional regulator